MEEDRLKIDEMEKDESTKLKKMKKMRKYLLDEDDYELLWENNNESFKKFKRLKKNAQHNQGI